MRTGRFCNLSLPSFVNIRIHNPASTVIDGSDILFSGIMKALSGIVFVKVGQWKGGNYPLSFLIVRMGIMTIHIQAAFELSRADMPQEKVPSLLLLGVPSGVV